MAGTSFRVKEDGLTLVDCKPTVNPVEGKSGTAKSLACAPSKGMLFVLHSFGPDHLRLMSVDTEASSHRARSDTQRIPTTSPTA